MDVELQQSLHPDSQRLRGLTDGGEDACEAEIVHSVERQQVEQELLSFFLKKQERVRFIQLPVWGTDHTVGMFREHRRCVSPGPFWLCPDLSSSWFISSSFRCWDSIFFSRARWIQARACPTSDRPSLIVWINLEHPRNEEE